MHERLFNERLNEFLAKLTDFCRLHPIRGHFWKENDCFMTDFGRRYIRIVKNATGFDRGRHTTVYCFVDRTNGNILKAATWKAPAKNGVRANIFDDDHGIRACDFCKLKYLRR